MKLLRVGALLAVAALGMSLAACSTTEIDTAIQRSLPDICSAAATTHIAFVAVAEATGRVSERTIAREAAAYNSLKPLCVSPSTATSTDVLLAAVRLYTTMTTALREAERAAPS